MTPVKIIICGSKGRMGQTLIACAKADPELQLAGEIDQGDDLSKVVGNGDVIVDFSVHDATLAIAKLAAQHKKALVIGTTGHSDAEKQAVHDAVKSIPVVWASNFSTGVNALFWITRKVAEIMEEDWNVKIDETHHAAKKDAPSGTARNLQALFKEVKNIEVPTHSERTGNVVGDHKVTFILSGEHLELTHRAGSRDIFARGALRAAKWVVKQKPGMYNMQDVLKLK